MRDLARCVFMTVCVAGLMGCRRARTDEDYPRQPTYPVSGQVLVGSRRAAQAEVVFNPVNAASWKGPFPTAMTDAEGKFHLQTYEGVDGAPAGKYTVTIIWRSPGEREERPDQLKGRYADVARTPLRVEIHEKENRLTPFLLK